MEIELLISFLGASVLLAIMPGPDNIFVMTESITKGHKTGIAISIGLCLGVLVHTIAASTGLSIVIQKSALAFSIIKYLGAGYLIYLAIMASKDKKPSLGVTAMSNGREKSLIELVRKGFIMNILNPKVSLFFIAFFPQFISDSGMKVSLQMLILGLIFLAQALVIFILISVLSGRLTNILNSTRFWKFTKWSKVGVLTVLGLSLAISNR